MILVKPSFKILGVNPEEGSRMLMELEAAGRTCYKSETSITADSACEFVKRIINRGHHSVLEHKSVSVRVVCDRGVSHEIVRHRIASYSQESTRYCNYAGGVTFVIPPWIGIEPGEYRNAYDINTLSGTSAAYHWASAMEIAEDTYIHLLSHGHGWSPQWARSVLPNSLKTEIVMTMNLREWRHFFRLRALGASGKPHPQMVEIALPMLHEFQRLIPIVFDWGKDGCCV